MGLFDWFKPRPAPTARSSGPSKAPPTAWGARPTADPFEQAMQLMAPLRRAAFVPRVVAAEGHAGSSHFCGNAGLPEGEAWPTCGYCKGAMELFLQLHAKDLPAASGRPFGEGTLQLFYCVAGECDCQDDAWQGFGASQLVRVVPADRPLRTVQRPASCTFATKLITGWDEQDDYPNWEESELHGVKLEKPLDKAFYEQDECLPITGEKLLGWPCWVQNVEYLDCPTCGERMTAVFQIDSERNVPYMFGDCGVGHISVCLKHPGRGGFRWACC